MTAEKNDGKARASRIIDQVEQAAVALSTATGVEPCHQQFAADIRALVFHARSWDRP